MSGNISGARNQGQMKSLAGVCRLDFELPVEKDRVPRLSIIVTLLYCSQRKQIYVKSVL